MRKKVLLGLIVVLAVFVSCRRDPPVPPVPPPHVDQPGPTSPVVFDPTEVPYAALSSYNFFQGDLVDLDPVHGVLPYDVLTPLFSDYAEKERFVWMPAGKNATYAGDHDPLDFPDGAVLIKNFYYDNVQPSGTRLMIETRLLFRRNDVWEFANYVWNDAQTDAVLDMGGSTTPVDFVDENGVQRHIDYRIPSGAECHTCHKLNSEAVPIGPKPQNLAMVHAYVNGTMDQLAKWVEVGYLGSGLPANINAVVRWDDATKDLNDRVRAYLDMNCAHCHSDGRHCDYRPMRFAFEDTADPENIGVCVPPDEPFIPQHTHIVSRGSVPRSVLHYRIASTAENERMPLLGRTVVHEEALELLETWIEQLEPLCD